MRTALLALLAAVVASSAAHAAYAQTIPHITMSADSDVYEAGDTIRMGGLVGVENGGAVTIRVMSPTGAVVAVGQVIPDGRDWSWTLPAEFDAPGTYTILAHYSLTGDPERRAAATFVYVTAEEGAVVVDGTEHSISYVGDPIMSVYTDATDSLIYVTFDGPSGGVMSIPAELYTGELVAVEGGMLTPLPDGSYAYSTDSSTLVLAADAVAVPEFGAAMLAAAGAAAAIPALRRFRAAGAAGMSAPGRKPLHRTINNSYGSIISHAGMQAGAAEMEAVGQEPLDNTIRNSFERITSHMKMHGVPSGWPAVPAPKISGHVDCVIQYVDMSGSTKLALDAGVDRYALLVTAFCKEVAQIVRQHGGHPLKYVGDAVMSVYTGYSLNAADSALGAAVSIMRMMHHAYSPATGERIDAHAAMSYGQVVAISQGDGADILGAPVNLAAKMLALGRPVVMDAEFRERLHPESEDILELDGSGWQYGGRLYEYTGGFHG